MKFVLKAEESAMFLFGIYLFYLSGYDWWWFPALILLPDLSMTGYIFNNKTGAILYNFFHHKGIAVIFYLIGIYFQLSWLELTGIILFSHSSMDRIFGYGLKYNKGFNHTHLGVLKKEKND
ncbi:MAG: DUF4260 domain-containing protein [Flavobacteriaceae bacterium]|jgi:hypothetical protein|nr:DUF4260 domain-containing protein [Flavobacteriaceae bacterium]